MINRQGLIVFSLFVFFMAISPHWVPGSEVVAQEKSTEDPVDLENREPPEFDGNEQVDEPTGPTVKPELPPEPPGINPETLRLMDMIERKNRDLKRREKEMVLREKNLLALEAKVKGDLAKIELALTRSEEQVGIKRDLIEKNVNNLVKVYSAMKAAEAARLLEKLDEGVAIQIVSRMKSKTAGKVLGKMGIEVAKRISERIAGKRFDDVDQN